MPISSAGADYDELQEFLSSGTAEPHNDMTGQTLHHPNTSHLLKRKKIKKRGYQVGLTQQQISKNDYQPQ